MPVGDILKSTSVSGSHSRLLASENVGTLMAVSWKFCPTTFCAMTGVTKSKMVSVHCEVGQGFSLGHEGLKMVVEGW